MLNQIKSTSKNSIIYGFGNVSVKIVGLILIPIYTDPAYLSIKDYGVLGIIESTALVLAALLGIALSQAHTRWYWDDKHLDKQKSITFSLLAFLTIIAILACIAFYPFAGWFSDILFQSPKYRYLLKLMFFSSCLQAISTVPLNLLRLQNRSGLYSISNIAKLVVTLFLTIYFVVNRQKGLEGIYEAQVWGMLFLFAILSLYILRNITFKPEWKILVAMLIYSSPLILGSISSILLSVFDRYSLNYLAELQDVGIYSLGYRIANTIKVLVVSSVQLAIVPLMFQMIGKPGNHRFYSKVMTYFTFLVMPFVIGLSVFGFEILKVFTRSAEYWEAYKIIPVISFSILFGMMKDNALMGLHIMKRTKIIGFVIVIVATMNLILNIILIPPLGIMGAAIATLISHFILFTAILFFSQKAYPIPYESGKLILIILTGGALIFIGLIINEANLFIRIIVKTGLCASFPFILYVFGFYEKVEIEALKGGWSKWRKPGQWLENIKNLISM